MAGDGGNIFDVTADDAGTVNGGAFDAVENLVSGDGQDTFNLSAALSGNISAGGGDDTVNVNDGGGAAFIDGGAGTNDVVSYAGQLAGLEINTSGFTNFESLVGSDFNDTINLNSDQNDDFLINGGAGSDEFVAESGSTIAGDLTVNNVESAAIDANINATNVTLDVAGEVTTDGGIITAQALDVDSSGGQALETSVQTFTGTNSGTGNMSLSNTGTLTVQNVTQSGSGDLAITTDGNMTQSGDVTSSGGSILMSASNGSLSMNNGTNAVSSGGDITYSSDAAGGDVTIGSLRTCAGTECTSGDTGVVSVFSENGDVLGNTNPVHITAATAVIDADGNIGVSLSNPLVFEGMLADVTRITISFSGEAFIDTRGSLFQVTSGSIGDVTEVTGISRETAASAQAAALEEDTSVDWAAFSEDVTVYEVNNEGVQLPQDQQEDDFAKLKQLEEAEAEPVPVSQLIETR